MKKEILFSFGRLDISFEMPDQVHFIRKAPGTQDLGVGYVDEDIAIAGCHAYL
jgi:hypothetical protein